MDADEVQTEAAIPGLRWLRNAYVLTAVAGLGFFVLSFLVLAVWPNRTLDKEIAETRPSGLPILAENELRGRAIYGREGCGNCHSQLIRMTADDVRRFGVVTQAWETADEFPQIWGTRRVGPDLSRERGRRARDWHLAHLWDPRWVVPDSNMPRYPWLFGGSATQPTGEAQDLVAYLETLGRGAALAGLSGPAPVPGVESAMEKFCDCAIPRTPGPPLLLGTRLEPTEQVRFGRRGAEAFTRNCAGCHGPAGRGDGPAAAALLPKPRDLSTARFSDAALSEVFWTGVPGSSMPGWHDLPANELRALAVYVRSLEVPASQKEAGLSPAEMEQARPLFLKNCQNCHGANGGGPSFAATAVVPAPTNFRRIQPTSGYAEKVLADGVPGTAMTPWKDKLSTADRRLLARYVRTLFAEDLP
jgi:cytochrome c oxidase cbb3-type subunit 2/cytochrome c oxidase cbb3-type subunit I/II